MYASKCFIVAARASWIVLTLRIGGVQRGATLVGNAAAEVRSHYSSSSSSSSSSSAEFYHSFKRLLGRKAIEVEYLMPALPYLVVEDDRGEAVMYSAAADGLITPVELSSWLLQHLVQLAQQTLRQTVTGAVSAKFVWVFSLQLLK